MLDTSCTPARPVGSARYAVAPGLLVALLLLSSVPAPAAGSGAAASAIGPRSVPSGSGLPGAHHPPGLGFGSSAVVRPDQTDEFYTQEGATIGQVNGTSAAGVRSLTEYVRLRSSPYSTAYELNGLTNSGDWWQITVGDNWPGCNSGFEELSEIWGVGDASGPVTCSSNVTVSSGDLVELNLTFHSGKGCLGLADLTAGGNYTYCAAQPDSGGTEWEFLSVASDMDGYYTGPMTEVINLTIASCPDNTHMPRMEYLFPTSVHVTEYTPWSDEFDLASGTMCYTSGNSTQSISPGDPASYYANTAAGTRYGPHWVGGQNYSMVNASYGFRFETDALPMSALSLSGGPTTLTSGASAHFVLNVSGGSAPYQALWSLNGAWQALGATQWNWTGGPAGHYAVVGYAVDTDESVAGPSNTVTITVPGPLSVSPINATPSAGLDLGGSVTFTVGVSGGFGFDTVHWTGLPTGCGTENRSQVVCVPTAAGSSNVSVVVTDQNGSHVAAGPLPYRVYPALQVVLNRSAGTIDLGETVEVRAQASGGSGGFGYAWTVPASCTARGAAANCTPVDTVPVVLSVVVTDSLGTATAPVGVAINVNADLELYVPAPRVLTDANVRFHATVVASGGTEPLTFVWSGLPSGCDPSGPVANCTAASAGTLTVTVRATDATGASSVSPAITVIAASSPTVTLALSASPSVAGDTVTFSATAVAGTGPYDYAWSGLPAGCASTNSPTIECAPETAGSYDVVVRATDAAGANVTATATLTVTDSAPPSGPSGVSFGGTTWLYLALLAAAAIAAVAIVVARRRYR